jgi:copper(I)-binding protein
VTHTLRRVRLAVATVIALVALAGCGTGFDAQTDLVQGPEGTQAETGNVLIRNAQLVVATADGATAALVVGLVNKGTEPDTLTEIKVGGGATTTESTLPINGLELPPGELVSVGSLTGPSIMVRTDPGELAPGSFVQLTLGFRVNGEAQISVPVQDRAGPRATVPVPPFPTATTPGPAGTPGPTESPSPPAAATPQSTPTQTAT